MGRTWMVGMTTSLDTAALSHNLLGQRLGRKGRDTRERILAATERLLDGPRDQPITLSAVAREASLGMTTLYLYFSDMTELLLAALDPIMASAEGAYMGLARGPWPDEALGEHCLGFVEAYYTFWRRHTRILHLRNSLADGADTRMRDERRRASMPLYSLILRQLGGDAQAAYSPANALTSVLLTGVERVITMATDLSVHDFMGGDPDAYIRNLLAAQARVLELGLRDGRTSLRALQ